jgi:iron complex outermembrane recepter protein
MPNPTSAPQGAARSLRLRPVAAACVLAVLGADIAHAQATADQTVVVTGIRRAIESSINTKRSSDSIVEAISSEDLGKLPDSSIAEALARLPGLTGQRGTDGRVNLISIRGLSPKFSGTLLNGREIVSSNDGRAVEYDQFPSELIGSGVVHKTPSAALIGQGLSGTVDLMSRRPLDTRGREVAFNARLERNSNDTQVPGVASPTGKRISASYVNQFANNTIGVAVGFAHLESTSQVRVSELDQYGDYSVYDLPTTGIPPSLVQAPSVSWGPTSKAMLPMFWTASQSTKKNTRDGLMAVLEYKPNKDLRTQLDLYYSKFDTHEVGGKLTSFMFATWGQAGARVPSSVSDVVTTQVGQNTYATRAPSAACRHDDQLRHQAPRRRSAVGWNTELKLGEQWTGHRDLSYSRNKRDETYQEVYAGPWDPAANGGWAYGPFKWNMPVDGAISPSRRCSPASCPTRRTMQVRRRLGASTTSQRPAAGPA